MIVDLPRKSWKTVRPSPWPARRDRARVAAVAIRAGLAAIGGDIQAALVAGLNRLAYAAADLVTPQVRYAC